MPLEQFFSGDLQCQCTLMGRPNAGPHFCMQCGSTKLTNHDVNCNLPGLTVAHLNANIGKRLQGNSEIKQRKVLLPMIPIKNRYTSMHLRLGVTTHILKMLLREVYRFGMMHVPEIRIAYMKKYTLQGELRAIRAAWKDAELKLNAKKRRYPENSQDVCSIQAYKDATTAVKKCENFVAGGVVALRKLEPAANQKTTARQKNLVSEAQTDLQEAQKMQAEHIANCQRAVDERDAVRARVLQFNPAAYVLAHKLELNLSPEEVRTSEKEAEEFAIAEATYASIYETYKQKYDASLEAENALKVLCKEGDSTTATALQDNATEILSGEQINSAKWFGGTTTLQGQCSWNLLQKADKYIPKILAACKQSFDTHVQETDESKRVLWDVFEAFTDDYKEVVASAFIVYSKIESVTLLRTTEFAELENAVSTFSSVWRKLGWSLTPKFHLTEKHVLAMAATGNLGIMSEGIVERMHYQYNLLKPQTHNTGTWVGNQIRMHETLTVNNAPEVTMAARAMEKNMRRRNSSVSPDPAAAKKKKSRPSNARSQPWNSASKDAYLDSKRVTLDNETCMKAIIPKNEIQECK